MVIPQILSLSKLLIFIIAFGVHSAKKPCEVSWDFLGFIHELQLKDVVIVNGCLVFYHINFYRLSLIG